MLGTVKDTTKGGVYGTIYPFGKTNMGDKLLQQTIWRAGGWHGDWRRVCFLRLWCDVVWGHRSTGGRRGNFLTDTLGTEEPPVVRTT